MPDVDVVNTGLLPAGAPGWKDRVQERVQERLQERLQDRLQERVGPARSRRSEATAWPRRLIVAGALLGGDAAAVLAACGASLLVMAAAGALPGLGPATLLGWCALQIGTLTLCGLYEPIEAEPIERLRRRGLAAAFAFGAAVLVGGGSSPWLSTAAGLAALLSIPLGHYAEGFVRARLVRRGVWGAATIVYGEGAADLARSLAARPELGLRPIGIVREPADGVEPFRTAPLGPAQDQGGAEHMAERMADLLATAEVAICTPGEREPARFAWLTRHPFRQVIVAHQAPEVETVRLQTRCLGPVVGLVVRRAIFLPHNLRLKRALDLAVTLPALILFAPLIGMLALAVKLADPGPAFYVQPRVGRDGRTIRVYKLRSMFRDAEARLADHLAADEGARREWERFCKLRNDPRVLPGIGGFIRRTSLDELPQLLNVLRGDMSVVGPRPFPAYHTERFGPTFQALRASVPPGLTGLWQISARSDGDLAVQEQQDSFYIRNWSIWIDLYILLETVPAVLTAKGAR
ncbi:exopolysaccharide biosynthesis polyprenyl glycosylphosphotransferase [Methylobacterium sp. R2-1]|uniref:exopolysaccharide biosynthesis polyprenyl glycosylphosphotransferase n=1 Tax=Methylobacterium sp. R2-1 TaxID=2587064 RepID=UPI00160AA556|nr:exopolysaccharide biosynthesis polyprenyl glycosylphosphotransferase [Methylobacterium sp. R2-1]MBB2962097.1 Undecaprenyl-phosphate galactose phosphotransferase WbaP [Methylobacterium sp. R2-1]